jgi:hypothetical protein
MSYYPSVSARFHPYSRTKWTAGSTRTSCGPKEFAQKTASCWKKYVKNSITISEDKETTFGHNSRKQLNFATLLILFEDLVKWNKGKNR